MLKARILPCLLLKGTGLVKTINFKNPTYLGDSTNAVRIFNQREVDELIFLDIDATTEHKTPPIELISKISDECFMPLAYGGGIRNMKQVRELFKAGVEKVIINSYAYENPSFITEIAEEFGSQSVVVSIDVKKKSNGTYETYSHGGQKATGREPIEFALEMEKYKVGELMINSIDRDGTMKGYDLKLIRQVSDAVSVPVIACGGAGKTEDLRKAIKEGHASAVAAGSLFVFYGPRRAVLINFPDKKIINKIRS